jgi:PPOX class probable F420-dependent enzyme
MKTRLNDDARRLLRGANYGYLSTLMPGGEPKVEPVWLDHEDDLVLITTDGTSIKSRNAEADARVALAMTSFEDPYDQLLIRGRIAEVRQDDDLTFLDRMSVKYIGVPFPKREWERRVVLVIEPSVVRTAHSGIRHQPAGESPTGGRSA